MATFSRAFIVLLSLFSLGGCVSVVPEIHVQPEFWSNSNQSIGVVVAKLPTPITVKSGNQGLLDVLINDSNASDLDKHLASLDLSSINQMQDKIVEYLNGKNISAKKIEEQIDIAALPEPPEGQQSSESTQYAAKDFKALKAQYDVDKLLIISVTRIGTLRSYYGFIPTSAPVGSSMIAGQIVNLDTNQLEWSQTATQNVPGEGEWDTPPDFPGLTKAVYSAYEQTQQMLLNHFMQ